jgi:hypothetical protein
MGIDAFVEVVLDPVYSLAPTRVKFTRGDSLFFNATEYAKAKATTRDWIVAHKVKVGQEIR